MPYVSESEMEIDLRNRFDFMSEWNVSGVENADLLYTAEDSGNPDLAQFHFLRLLSKNFSFYP